MVLAEPVMHWRNACDRPLPRAPELLDWHLAMVHVAVGSCCASPGPRASQLYQPAGWPDFSWSRRRALRGRSRTHAFLSTAGRGTDHRRGCTGTGAHLRHSGQLGPVQPGGAPGSATRAARSSRANSLTGRRCEYGDLRAKLSWNFYGAPALGLKEFANWKPGLVVGTSVQVTAPTGTYKSHHLINAGTNRWMVRPGIGHVIPGGPMGL